MNWQSIHDKLNLPDFEWLRLPPDQNFHTLIHNPDYLTAAHYLGYNAGLTLLALVLGLGCMAGIARYCQATTTPQPSQPIGAGLVAFLAIGAGFAVITAELFTLGLMFWLTPMAVASCFSASVLLAMVLLWRGRHALYSMTGSLRPGLHGSIAIAFIVLLVVVQFGSATSPYMGDATAYHVPYAGFMLQHHGLAIQEHLIYPYHSLNINLLYSLGLMIEHKLTYVQSLNALFATLCMLGIYLTCRFLKQREGIAILLAFLFVQLYIIRFNRFIANVDMGGMFFVFSAIIPLLAWRQNRQAPWAWVCLICSAVSLGIAMGSKYILCMFSIPIGIYILLFAGNGFTGNLRILAVYAGWSAAFGLWWYIRNWILTGNPVHPFAPGIFGYYLWDEADMQAQMQPILNTFIPRTLTGILALPWHAYTSDVLRPQHVFLLVTLLYFNTLASLFLRAPANALLIFCWVYLVFWVFGSQDPRHFVPLTPLILVHFGALLDTGMTALGNGIKPLFRKLPNLAMTALSVTPGLLLCLGALAFATYDARDKALRVYYSQLTPVPGQPLKKRLGNNAEYDIIMTANELFRTDETIYEFAMRDARWFYRGNMVGAPFGPHGYWRIITAASYADGRGGIDPAQLQRILQERYHASGFLIPNATDDITSMPYKQQEFDDYFELLYRNSMGSIYRFKSHP